MDKKIKTFDIVLIALFTAILYTQEQLLSFLPNIQLTVFLIIFYSKVLKMKKTIIIVILHTILDNITWGSFNLLVFPFMLAGWLIIPITLNTVFKKVSKELTLALLSILYSLIYSWIFIIPNILLLEIDFFVYLISDISFEILLCASSFVTTLWLYNPLKKTYYNLITKEE